MITSKIKNLVTSKFGTDFTENIVFSDKEICIPIYLEYKPILKYIISFFDNTSFPVFYEHRVDTNLDGKKYFVIQLSDTDNFYIHTIISDYKKPPSADIINNFFSNIENNITNEVCEVYLHSLYSNHYSFSELGCNSYFEQNDSFDDYSTKQENLLMGIRY